MNKDMKEIKQSGFNLLMAGEFDSGITELKKYLNLHPDDTKVLSVMGDAYLEANSKTHAFEYYMRALSIAPVDTANLLKFSALKLPAPNYIDILRMAHHRLKPQRYIEIGVCKGVSFDLVAEETTSIGVDPEPQLDVTSLPKNHKVISDTSDNYFASKQIEEDFNDKPFDMAFLDGMHLFEFALRDFMNLEKYSHAGSVVFVHDLYPMNAETATRARNSDFWSGDVWKLVLCLKEYRPDLGLEVLPCPPTGLGYITKLDANSTVLSEKYDEILEKYIDMSFDVIENDREEKLLLTGVDHPMLVLP